MLDEDTELLDAEIILDLAGCGALGGCRGAQATQSPMDGATELAKRQARSVFRKDAQWLG